MTYGKAKPGDVLRNTHQEDVFTCPNCHEDHHDHGASENHSVFITCDCGKRLRLVVEMIPEAACYIADEDEGDDDD